MEEPNKLRGEVFVRIANGCAWVAAVAIVFVAIVLFDFFPVTVDMATSERGFGIISLVVLSAALIAAIAVVIAADRAMRR